MARPAFNPASDEDKALAAIIVRLGQRRQRLETEIDQALIAAERQRFPDLWVADKLGIDRKTVSRRRGAAS